MNKLMRSFLIIAALGWSYPDVRLPGSAES